MLALRRVSEMISLWPYRCLQCWRTSLVACWPVTWSSGWPLLTFWSIRFCCRLTLQAAWCPWCKNTASECHSVEHLTTKHVKMVKMVEMAPPPNKGRNFYTRRGGGVLSSISTAGAGTLQHFTGTLQQPFPHLVLLTVMSEVWGHRSRSPYSVCVTVSTMTSPRQVAKSINNNEENNKEGGKLYELIFWEKMMS